MFRPILPSDDMAGDVKRRVPKPDEFGFSPTYLSRMFKRYADVSYKTYLLNLRTEYGMREMMNTDRSLNDVAVNNGFPNSRAFAKAFLSRYGCLPSEYRKKAGKGQESDMKPLSFGLENDI